MKKDLKVKKWHLVFIVILLLCYTGLKLWQLRWPNTQVVLAGQNLNVLVANNYYHMHKGMGGRKSFEGFDGMLFVYNFLDRHGIVMRDMLIPIDIVWLHGGSVVDFAKNVPIEPGAAEAQLFVYRPRADADLVLELPAGWADSNALKIGDKMTLPISK